MGMTHSAIAVQQRQTHQTRIDGVDVWWILAEAVTSDASCSPDRSLRWWSEHPALAPEERERVARFGHVADAWAFAAARIQLRAMLAHALEGVEPHEVPIVVNQRGKPCLADPDGPAFNVTHTVDLNVQGGWRALVAVALASSDISAVGIDVERVDRFHGANLVERFFTEGERAELAALAPELLPERRAVLWTCKEAFVKATGTGIAGQFGNFEMSLDPGPSLRRSPPGEHRVWRFSAIEVPPDFRASLVVGRA